MQFHIQKTVFLRDTAVGYAEDTLIWSGLVFEFAESGYNDPYYCWMWDDQAAGVELYSNMLLSYYAADRFLRPVECTVLYNDGQETMLDYDKCDSTYAFVCKISTGE